MTEVIVKTEREATALVLTPFIRHQKSNANAVEEKNEQKRVITSANTRVEEIN